jgi:AcrR family transcriptional regulator
LARREQILGHATRLIGKRGLTVLTVESLARSCGVSKALIYVHFATPTEILAGVLRREFESLRAAGLDEVLAAGDCEEAAVAAAAIYARHVSKHGAVLHALLSDPLFVRHMSPAERRLRDGAVRKLVRRLHREMGFSIKHAGFVVALLAAIPERAGLMAYEGALDLAAAEALCAELVRASLSALADELNAG